MRHPLGLRFEKKSSRVIYVTADDIYRVTPDSIVTPIRTMLDARYNLVGIAAAVTYWEKVDKRSHCLGCARTVKEAWNAGDRYLLDTDEARRAAELVADLADTRPDDIDICSAIADLSNAIASVRLSNTPLEQFEVLPILKAAIEKCFSIDGFCDWDAHARRCRFLYTLDRSDRTPVVYTLMDLYFNYGHTPLLTTKQKQEMLKIGRGEGVEGAVRFFDDCIRQITAYRYS